MRASPHSAVAALVLVEAASNESPEGAPLSLGFALERAIRRLDSGQRARARHLAMRLVDASPDESLEPELLRHVERRLSA